MRKLPEKNFNNSVNITDIRLRIRANETVKYCLSVEYRYLLICMILVEQNISIKAKNPRCLRNLACVVFYHEPAKYPSQIDSQISITLTGQSTELEKDFMGVCRWNN